MTNLVLGASGFVGSSLHAQLKSLKKEVVGTYFSNEKKDLIKVDMTSKSDLSRIFSNFSPKIIYMPAFIPGVDYCEKNEKPNTINKTGVRNVVDKCKEYKAKLIFFSSDYVFDGKEGPYLEQDTPNPINKYGDTKLQCEKMIQELENYLIIRTTVVYGYDIDSKNFMMSLTEDLMKRETRKVPIDQVGSPTYVEDLAKITIKLTKFNKTGIYNVVGPDYCSRYIFALKIARIFELDETLIIPVETSELGQIADRPKRAGLIIDKIRKELDAEPLGMEEALLKLKPFVNNFKSN